MDQKLLGNGNAADGNAEGWHGLKNDGVIFTGMLGALQVVCIGYSHASKMTYSADPGMQTPSYVMFIHVSIMIFFGFGFLMTFLRRHGYSAVGLCVVVSAAVIQLSIVMEDVFKRAGLLKGDNWGELGLFNLINGLFCAGAVMISMGAVLGKVAPCQLLFMGLVETVLYWVSFSAYTVSIGAQDAAGGIVLHAFGAYFGLVVSKMITQKESLDHEENSTVTSSDLFSLAGTLFLWLLWPSFCAAVAPTKEEGFHAVCNTFLALVGSVMGFAIMSRLLHEWKFNVVEMQNATLAGGVAMGVPATVAMGPACAMSVGLIAGIISTVGYATLDLGEKIGLSDTCGVNNLHGMPGLLSGIVGLFFFPVAAQASGMLASLGVAVIGAVLTGGMMKLLPGLDAEFLFGDEAFWEVADDYNLKKE